MGKKADRPGHIRGPRTKEDLAKISAGAKKAGHSKPTPAGKRKLNAILILVKRLKDILDFPDSPLLTEIVQDFGLTKVLPLPKWKRAEVRRKYGLPPDDSGTA